MGPIHHEAIPLRRSQVDLRALLRSKLAVISSQALAADVVLNVTVADDVPAQVNVDPPKLAWAVTTLVGNALRYVQSGPRRSPRGTIDVRVTSDRRDAHVAIEVQDDGPGIPSETVARLFKGDGLNVTGTGLALLLMSDILTAHGGHLDVMSERSEAKHGTTVRLTFPAG
jgi:signal transduction histidine kinase